MLIHIVSAFEQSGRIDDSVRQGYQGVTCDQARRSASATPACGQLIPALRQISPIAVLPLRVGSPSRSSGRQRFGRAPRRQFIDQNGGAPMHGSRKELGKGRVNKILKDLGLK